MCRAGFPPRHSKHLPSVIDEPSVFDYIPQHQSTCGLNFNDPVVPGDPAVRQVRTSEIDLLMPACVAMFTEEVGVSPLAGGAAEAYRARVAELVRHGRAYARIDDGRVVFTAEIGAVITFMLTRPRGVTIRDVVLMPSNFDL